MSTKPDRRRWSGRKPRSTALIVVLVGGGIAAAASFAGQAVAPAPSTEVLPLASGAAIVIARPGGSEVDTANDPQRYRYMVIAGRRAEAPSAFLLREDRGLRRAGWRHVVSWSIPGDKTLPQPSPTLARGATLQADSPQLRFYVLMSLAHNPREAEQMTESTVLEGAKAIELAAKQHPLIFVTVGNGHAPRVY